MIIKVQLLAPGTGQLQESHRVPETISSHIVFVYVAWYAQNFSVGVESMENPMRNAL